MIGRRLEPAGARRRHPRGRDPARPRFCRDHPEGDEVEAGAGALDLNVALTAAEAGIAGLEFLSGIPGTVGGGFRTNAGAYGSEFKDVLVSAEAVDRDGEAASR